MKIKLTPSQWDKLKILVLQGKLSEVNLGLPMDITNGDQKIEITTEGTKITLSD